MLPLVYLHIPKAAGTSHRQYLFQVYSENAVFWYGLNSDAERFVASEVNASAVIGGHRPLHFYPPSFNAVYSSILRDPVERAVSFFNYCSAPPVLGTESWRQQREADLKAWRDKGVDPGSMLRSIKNSHDFRREISNLQCQYLSRHGATFSGVRKTLEEEDMVVGVFDRLDLFNEFFQRELGYPIENKRKANAGTVGYSEDILAEPGLVDVIRSLNTEDQRLYDYVRFECRGIYSGTGDLTPLRAGVPRAVANACTKQVSGDLAGSNADPETSVVSKAPLKDPVEFPWGNVHIFTRGLVMLRTDSQVVVTLIVRNDAEGPLEFAGDDPGTCSIGWQFRNASGGFIESMKGVARVRQRIPAKGLKAVQVMLQVTPEQLLNERPTVIEFSLVKGDDWLRERYPLNCAWGSLLYT
ncbi:MAG: sulfotransferase family 2 domain-containing protein [Halioglobus sp.]